MDSNQICDFFEDYEFENKSLAQNLKYLQRKKIRMKDPYISLLNILTFYFSSNDKEKFTKIYSHFISSNIEELSRLEMQFWSYIEPSILMGTYLGIDKQNISFIKQRGFVASRLEESSYQHFEKNLKIEIDSWPKYHYLPKETIAWRYQILIGELLLILLLKESSIFPPSNKYVEKLNEYKAKYFCIIENYYLKDEELYNLLT